MASSNTADSSPLMVSTFPKYDSNATTSNKILGVEEIDNHSSKESESEGTSVDVKQKPSRRSRQALKTWNEEQLEALTEIMIGLVNNGQNATQRWVGASQQMRDKGYPRSPNACRIIWTQELRGKTGIDERTKRKLFSTKHRVGRNGKRSSGSPVDDGSRRKQRRRASGEELKLGIAAEQG